MKKDKKNVTSACDEKQLTELDGGEVETTQKKSQKNKKQKYIDDGHTIYNMDGVQSPFSVLKNKSNDGEKLNRAEKRAAIKAALQVYLPIVLGSVACFALVGVLMYLWLR